VIAGAVEGQVVFALGSNLGDRLACLQGGVDALTADQQVMATAVSGVYETRPVGGPDQPDYLNAVLIAVSALPPRALLDRCQAAERASGRVRSVRWGPRTLDIDLITYEAQTSDDPALTLPHPRAHERAFVLVPWLDADPDAELPGFGPVADLADKVGDGGVRRRDDLKLRISPRRGRSTSPALADGTPAPANRGG
jgi:2-amino-4-hydroxy-6-hydroxymethyldihydropteridine diphosphokinase